MILTFVPPETRQREPRSWNWGGELNSHNTQSDGMSLTEPSNEDKVTDRRLFTPGPGRCHNPASRLYMPDTLDATRPSAAHPGPFTLSPLVLAQQVSLPKRVWGQQVTDSRENRDMSQ